MPKALVIEDDDDTRANLCDLLELDDFEVVLADTAVAARDNLKNAPDIAILDRKLPDGLAEDLLPEFLRLAPKTKFVVVTGYADMENAIKAMRNGASDYLIKPIQPEAFRQRLKSIVEFHELERALYKEHAFASQVLATAEAVILVLDLDGRVQQFNPFLTELTGWTLDEVKGKDWFEVFIREEERQAIRDIFWETARETRTRGIINAIMTKGGELKELRWSNSTLRDQEGKPYAVLAVGLDITDLAESQTRALRAERLATIGQMMAALAHESRNALQRIQASTDLLGLEIGGNAQAAEDLAKIQRAAKDLNVLLEEVRAFAAPIHLRKERACLTEVIEQAWANLEQSRQGRDAKLIVSDQLQGVELSLDVSRAEQVFRNFFENSLSATGDPLVVNVSARPGDSPIDSADQTADSNGEERQIEITIEDNGPGLNPAQSAKIFEAFFTTKDDGTGLGMAIVQRIVEAHGGSAAVDSTCTTGARFILAFPLE